MTLLTTLRLLTETPWRFVAAECPIQLEAFFGGYGAASVGWSSAYDAVSRSFGGSTKWTLGHRIYVRERNRRHGFVTYANAILEVLEEAEPEPLIVNEYLVDVLFSRLREAIGHGRAPMYLGDDLVDSLYSFLNGYLAGLADLGRPDAHELAASLAAFEAWLQQRLPLGRDASWHTLITVHDGPSQQGLLGFVARWDEWSASLAPPPP